MIKFFRNIRQNLLNEGKTSKYLKYAIGEIVLVMIGILLALQVNNWNVNRMNRVSEKDYLSKLESDLENQLIAIEGNIYLENLFIEACAELISNIERQNKIKLNNETLKGFNDITIRATFSPVSTTFNELNSSGNLDLITNDTFKFGLIEYYQKQEKIVKKIDINNSDMIDNISSSELLHSIVYNPKYYSKPFKDLAAYTCASNHLLDEELINISEDILNTPKNKLTIINLINYRLTTARFHKKTLNQFGEDTQRLLNQLRNIYD